MKNITTHVGLLQVGERLPSSVNGNPRYLLSVDGVNCRTSVDSNIAYGLDHYNGKQVEATIGTHYGNETLNSIKLAE